MDFKGQTIIVTGGTSGIGWGHLDTFIRNEMYEAGYSYPHHSGSGVGVSFHEEPQIVPATSTPLESGMVIALEPAGLSSRIGAHVEHMIQITEGGALVLTEYNLTFNWIRKVTDAA